jgi:hypothetical protein
VPNLPDIPGKNLVSGSGRRAGKLAAAGGVAVIAVGGYVVRRIVRRGHGGEDDAGVVTADPIAETPTAPPEASEVDVNGGDPSAVEEAEEQADATEEQAAAPAPEPPAPEAAEPAPKDPHHALNNPATDPDPTEWPDPYDKRSDPLDPPDPDGEPFGEEPHVTSGAESTSQPHPDQDPEAQERAEALKRDKLDD